MNVLFPEFGMPMMATLMDFSCASSIVLREGLDEENRRRWRFIKLKFNRNIVFW
jgi:hypothetical protein